jgi:aldose 1-epimerase
MSTPDPVTAAGEQVIEHGDYTAVLTPVSAGIRLLLHAGTDLVVPYAAGEVRPSYRGAILAPWPNRVVDGRYGFAGHDYELALSEPARQHALHGLVAWTRFDAIEHDQRSVTWRHESVASTGYPWSLRIDVAYSLDDDGLTTTVTATNLSDSPAPYGVAPHPYLRVGDVPIDECELTIPAGRVLEVTPDRLIPTGVADVAGTRFDFRASRRIGDDQLDHAFTGLADAGDGPVTVRLRTPDGRGVACSWDPVVLPWVQVHTADVPGTPANRAGLATEPMSCPPDAFNSGTDLVVLEPGDSHSASWTISAD